MNYSNEEKWNLLVKSFREDRKAPESKIQIRWEGVCSDFLGYDRWRGEIECQKVERMGSLGREIADIILKSENRNVAVLELKQYNLNFSDAFEKQLFSYLNQFKCDLGILVCNKIYIYDYNYYEPNENQVKCYIEFEEDNKEGVEFLKLISKNEFNRSAIKEFIRRVAKLNKERVTQKPTPRVNGGSVPVIPVTPFTGKLKTGYIFEDCRNFKLLNHLLNKNYKGFMQAGYGITDNAIIWMVDLGNNINSGWKNYMVGDNLIVEEYLGPRTDLPDNFYIKHQYRHTFEKQKANNRFIFRGVFMYDSQNSTFYQRKYVKVADETNLLDF